MPPARSAAEWRGCALVATAPARARPAPPQGVQGALARPGRAGCAGIGPAVASLPRARARGPPDRKARGCPEGAGSARPAPPLSAEMPLAGEWGSIIPYESGIPN
jgi:hypothetical protein